MHGTTECKYLTLFAVPRPNYLLRIVLAIIFVLFFGSIMSCSARYNTIHLTGRIGNDPEPRYFDDGKVVVNLSLACRRKYQSIERKLQNIQSGEEETDWYGLEIWVREAGLVAPILKSSVSPYLMEPCRKLTDFPHACFHCWLLLVFTGTNG